MASEKVVAVLYSHIAKPAVHGITKTLPFVELHDVETVEEVIALIPKADALLLADPRGADGPKIAAALCKPDSRVQLAQMLSAGYDGLLAHELPEHLVAANQGGAVAPAVAEHAMTLLFSMTRHIGDIIAATARHEWARDFKPPMMSMEGRTIVIVGMGHIGRQIAKRIKGYDVKVIGVTRSGNPEELADETYPMEKLHEALGQGDMVALTVAAAPTTYNIMNDAAFAACKKGAYFVNVTRGETVDQAALKRTLESGHLAHAAIDVTNPEPLPSSDPLWGTPNLIISPHTAGGGGTGTGGRIAKVVGENLTRLHEGKPFIATVPLVKTVKVK